MTNVVDLSKARSTKDKIQLTKDQEEIRHRFLNPTVGLPGGLTVKLTDDGKTIAFYHNGELMDQREATAIETHSYMQHGLCQSKILLLLEVYQPESIDWLIPPSESVKMDDLLEKRERLKKKEEEPLTALLKPIETEIEYDKIVEATNGIVDMVGDKASHVLYPLMILLMDKIGKWEENNVPFP